AKLVADNRNDAQVIEELFLRFLARPPHAGELQVCLATLEAAQTDATAAENARDQILSQLAAKQAEWEASVGQPVVWTTVSEAVANSEQRAEFRTLDDGSILVSGERQKDVYEIEFTTELSQVGGFQLELLPHESLASGGPGRADNGNVVLSEFTADVLAANGDVMEACQLQQASADFSQDGWPVAGAIDGNLATGWAIMPEFGKPHTATFALAAPVVIPDGGRLRIRLSQQYPDGKHNIGRFRIAVTDATNPLDGDAIPQAVREALQVEASERTAEQNQQIADHVRSIHSDLDEGRKSLDLRIRQAEQYRLTGMQDIAWALINNPAFLFNR
ncbi:MAG: hypothetical protein KDA87_21435, partial [Planctomycetales bacterium]|nr:hypothetical protein [Planctomycetales bacterium]